MKYATVGRLAVTALLIAVPLGVASAADMAVKAPPAPPPPAFNWNGFYVGAYAGAAWMDQANTTDPCPTTLTAFCLATGHGVYNGVQTTAYDIGPSFVGGGTIGYNWQPTPFTLLGLENQIGYLHLKGSITQDPLTFNDTVATAKIGDWYDALTARVGAVDGHAMFYVKGGGTWVKYATGVVDNSLIGGATVNTNTTKTLTGWTAGGGVEYGIDMHWSVRAEYMVLGVAHNITGCGPGGGGFAGITFCSTTHTPDVQMIDIGLNYRFR